MKTLKLMLVCALVSSVPSVAQQSSDGKLSPFLVAPPPPAPSTTSSQATVEANGKRRTASQNPNVYQLQEGFVDAHGVLIYYKIIGRGAPLMIVHGGPGASHDYLLPLSLAACPYLQA